MERYNLDELINFFESQKVKMTRYLTDIDKDIKIIKDLVNPKTSFAIVYDYLVRTHGTELISESIKVLDDTIIDQIYQNMTVIDHYKIIYIPAIFQENPYFLVMLNNVQKMMYKPVWNTNEIKEAIQFQNKVVIYDIVEIEDRAFDRQTFVVLEWMKNHEFCIRRYYRFLNPSPKTNELQPLGIGGGEYLLLFKVNEDLSKAKKVFKERLESMTS